MKIIGDPNRDLNHGLVLRRSGLILLFAGPLSVVGLVVLFAVVFPSLQEGDHPASYLLLFAMVLGLCLSLFMACRLFYRGKQYSARGKAAAYKADTRQPVLYLRPFLADEGVRGLTRRMLQGAWRSIEEQLAEALGPIGPLVAIGKPGEQLPTPGALRQYFDNTTWQNAVRQLLLKARVIILRPGMSEGLWWELKEAVATKTAERLLILVLKMKQADYLPFSQLVRERLDIRLPNFNEVSRWRRVSGFFEFNAAWQAHFLPLKAPFLRTDLYMPLRATVNHTLQPLFTRFGVSWRPSPLCKVKLLLIGAIVLGSILWTIGYSLNL